MPTMQHMLANCKSDIFTIPLADGNVLNFWDIDNCDSLLRKFEYRSVFTAVEPAMLFLGYINQLPDQKYGIRARLSFPTFTKIVIWPIPQSL
jgi:hypothetical protein